MPQETLPLATDIIIANSLTAAGEKIRRDEKDKAALAAGLKLPITKFILDLTQNITIPGNRHLRRDYITVNTDPNGYEPVAALAIGHPWHGTYHLRVDHLHDAVPTLPNPAARELLYIRGVLTILTAMREADPNFKIEELVNKTERSFPYQALTANVAGHKIALELAYYADVNTHVDVVTTPLGKNGDKRVAFDLDQPGETEALSAYMQAVAKHRAVQMDFAKVVPLLRKER